MNTEDFSFSIKNTHLAVWNVGQLCIALAKALEQQFNPVLVKGEISGFMRAASGHCYFSLKDAQGQLRCAMFKRAASQLDFSPKNGDMVEIRAKIDVYAPRGDLQLIVESIKQAGLGTLFEQFMLLKSQLEQQGLFEQSRKRSLPLMPKTVGLITSLGAAALRDVASTLARRVPHVKVIMAPASVQGAGAAQELLKAFDNLEQYNLSALENNQPPIEVILLVRGGGSIEDLWSFNNEQLAHKIANCSVPVVSGVGHETDFTIADFVADVRAATPTAAAELICEPTQAWESVLVQLNQRMLDALYRKIDQQEMNLDRLLARLGRPSNRLAAQAQHLAQLTHQLQLGASRYLQNQHHLQNNFAKALPALTQAQIAQSQNKIDGLSAQLEMLSPNKVIARGYARLENTKGQAISSITEVKAGQKLEVMLQDGKLKVGVEALLPHMTSNHTTIQNATNAPESASDSLF